MQINIGDEQIIELLSPFSPDQVRERAFAKRVDAFGQMLKFIQRPKPEDIEIGAMQKRLECFWFATATARYVYDRKHTYRLDVAHEVQGVTLYGVEHPVSGDKNHAITFDGVERCVEEFRQEMTCDAQQGSDVKYDKHMAFPKHIIPDVKELACDGTLVVAPEVRGSFVVRKLVGMLMKTFQADTVVEERIDVEQVALYYRPVIAIEYIWRAKDKKQIVEFDALTGDTRAESGEFKHRVVKVLENDALFDIGADAIGTVFPGVNVAVKLGRLAARKALK